MLLNASHEKVWYPESVEEIASAVLFLAMIFTKLEIVVNVCVPRLKIHSKCTASLTAPLVNIAGCVIEDLKHRDQSIGVTIGTSDIGIGCAHISDRYSDTSR